MIPVELGIVIIIISIGIAILYSKMVLIWHDVMKKKNNELLELKKTEDEIKRLKLR